ncbi:MULTISPECIES: PaaI family thioesterase [unclassified Streptomyces]|uniref:PaaI family thioesterase n=1 Tax=unclassified Streptomyces TaxID=2593676 RepID=UPI0013193DBB|nr:MULTISPECIES: PaaI family thioesterase [unclassified Streptomyces]QHC27601.1 hotdog fold thioesterase [Streptomyces sp. HF10]WKE67625.1 PaaI family thioesterase [Streptomyces sp. WP-1]
MTMDHAGFAQSIFKAQPFSMFLGAELTSAGPDSAEIRVANRPEIQQQHGFVHGGVLSYLADNALTFAGGLALGGDALTAEYKINYVRPAVGESVVARAKATVTTRRQAVCQCSVYVVSEQGEERLVAVAQGTIVRAGKQED